MGFFEFIRNIPETTNLKLLLNEERIKTAALSSKLDVSEAKVAEQENKISRINNLLNNAKNNRPQFAKTDYDPFS